MCDGAWDFFEKPRFPCSFRGCFREIRGKALVNSLTMPSDCVPRNDGHWYPGDPQSIFPP